MSWLEDFVPGPVVSRSSSYSVPACNGQVVIVSALSAACTITLPASPVLGQLVIVKRAGAYDYPITIAGNGRTIDGAATLSALPAFACVSIAFGGAGWHVIDASVSAQAPAPTAASVLYVSKSGNDATAKRGDSSRPFATITAALAAAQSGDVVRVRPGTWDETVLIPELASIAIIGSGMDHTVINGVATDQDGTLGAYPATTAIDKLLIADLTVSNLGGFGVGLAIDISGANVASPGICPNDPVILRNVRAITQNGQGSQIMCAGLALVSGCDLDGLVLGNVARPRILGTSLPDTGSGLTVGWNPAADAPGSWTDNETHIAGIDTCALTTTGLANVIATGSALGTTAATLTADSGASGSLTAHACSMGAVTVSGDSATTGANLDGSTMASLVVTRSAGADRIAVSARGGSIAGAVSAGDGCGIDIRDSHFDQASLASVGDGTINRSKHVFRSVAGENGVPVTVVIEPPFPDANYAAFAMPVNSYTGINTESKTAASIGVVCQAEQSFDLTLLHD